jgi:pilus assembly protein Flp/PilA
MIKSPFLRFVREDRGQDLIEYALLAGFISLAAALAITNVGTGVNQAYDKINVQVNRIPAGDGIEQRGLTSFDYRPRKIGADALPLQKATNR